MTGQDAEAVVRQVLAAAGGRTYEARLAELERLDRAGCDVLFDLMARPIRVPVGADGAHPRDIAEDVWSTVITAARSWPDRFLDHVLASPDRHHDLAILTALGEVDRPEARALLVAATNERQAGHIFCREHALRSLIRLADPTLPDLLVRLVEDRAASVRFAAVVAAIEHGDARMVPALQHIADAAQTPAGTRRLALEAIEAITSRSSRVCSDPMGSDGVGRDGP